MSFPLISVIVPVYNVEKYLKECLDSVVSQTLSDIEIIAVNDGSTDSSPAVLREYASRDSRLKVIDKQNEGVGRARNDGINAASGKYLAFMDSDDFYPSATVLEELYACAEQNGVKIAGGRKIRLMQDGTFAEDDADFSEYGLSFSASGLCAYKYFQYDYGYTQYIYDRELIVSNGILFPSYGRFQDPPFFVRAMAAAGEFYACGINSYCYRMVPSQSKYSPEKTLDFISGLEDNLRFSLENGLLTLHCLTALRLDKEASFMAIHNITSPGCGGIAAKMIEAAALVDTALLRKNGFELKDPFLPGFFEYAVSAAAKYEKLRQNKALKVIKKISGKKLD